MRHRLLTPAEQDTAPGAFHPMRRQASCQEKTRADWNHIEIILHKRLVLRHLRQVGFILRRVEKLDLLWPRLDLLQLPAKAQLLVGQLDLDFRIGSPRDTHIDLLEQPSKSFHAGQITHTVSVFIPFLFGRKPFLALSVFFLLSHRMSYFATNLQKLQEARFDGAGGQTLFAKQLGLNQASLSRYLADQSRPDVKILEQICGALEPDEIAKLVIAYLEDDIPPTAKDLVRVVNLISNTRVAETPDPLPEIEKLPKKVQQAFQYLIREAVQHAVVGDAMIANVALMKGDRI